MNKFRNAIEEGKFAARIARQFFRAYRKWRDANPDADVAYVYVGHPDMGAAIAQQSPLWQRFERWEQIERAQAASRSTWRNPPYVSPLDDKRDATAAVHAVAPLLRPAECDCAACTASRATREESKAYDA